MHALPSGHPGSLGGKKNHPKKCEIWKKRLEWQCVHSLTGALWWEPLSLCSSKYCDGENQIEWVVQPFLAVCISTLRIGGLNQFILSKLSSLGRQVDVLHFIILLASHILPQRSAGIEFIAQQSSYLRLVNFLDVAHEHLCSCERGYENICE